MSAIPTAVAAAPGVTAAHHAGRRWVADGARVHAPRSVLHGWQRMLPTTAALSHLTAAELHGWWLPQLPDGLPVLVDQPDADHRTRRPGVRVTRTGRSIPCVEVDGLRVTTPAQTLLACARDVGLLDLVVLVDSALRAGCPVEDVRAACTPRRRGVVALRRALEMSDPRSESPGETALRVLHATVGAPVVPQRPVHDRSGGFVARADLWLEGTTTLHEYDGAVHRTAEQHATDLRRDRALTAIGWTRRGYVAADLRDRPLGVLRDIDDALGRLHDPARIDPWTALLVGSTFTAAGRTRLARRLTSA